MMRFLVKIAGEQALTRGMSVHWGMIFWAMLEGRRTPLCLEIIHERLP